MTTNGYWIEKKGGVRSDAFLCVRQSVHGFGHGFADFVDKQTFERIAHKVFCRQEHNFSSGNGECKRAHELLLLVGELEGAQFGNESGAHAALYNPHEGFDAAKMVGTLTATGGFEVTEAD